MTGFDLRSYAYWSAMGRIFLVKIHKRLTHGILIPSLILVLLNNTISCQHSVLGTINMHNMWVCKIQCY